MPRLLEALAYKVHVGVDEGRHKSFPIQINNVRLCIREFSDFVSLADGLDASISDGESLGSSLAYREHIPVHEDSIGRHISPSQKRA